MHSAPIIQFHFYRGNQSNRKEADFNNREENFISVTNAFYKRKDILSTDNLIKLAKQEEEILQFSGCITF